jgi:hypothetical protein
MRRARTEMMMHHGARHAAARSLMLARSTLPRASSYICASARASAHAAFLHA